jgi:hypothetical protein
MNVTAVASTSDRAQVLYSCCPADCVHDPLLDVKIDLAAEDDSCPLAVQFQDDDRIQFFFEHVSPRRSQLSGLPRSGAGSSQERQCDTEL